MDFEILCQLALLGPVLITLISSGQGPGRLRTPKPLKCNLTVSNFLIDQYQYDSHKISVLFSCHVSFYEDFIVFAS